MELAPAPVTESPFTLTDELQQAWQQLVTWLRINAIVSLVSFALSLCSFLYDVFADTGPEGSPVILLLVLITLLISAWMCWLLWTTSRALKAGMDQTSQPDFNEGIRLFNRYFRTLGIISVVLMVLMALVFALFFMSVVLKIGSQLE
ncbi:MAG TPA: hypothetical protein PKK69_09575 [Ferruginibacter sp.]|nr:hypothetical protein [Ferruginibacter sp.]